jgi:Cof subfamily protein (haloacid dehalogenase superfamily)
MSVETPIELFISDVDGTLVGSDKTLSDATIAAVGRLKDAGLPMSLISARPPSGMIWIAEKLDLDGPFGAFNGGVLFKRDGTVIERHCLDAGLAKAMVGLIAEAGITCWVFADDQWLSNSADDPHNQRELESANVQPTITEDFGNKLERADKIVGVSDDHELLVDLEDKVKAIAKGNATIARSQPYYLDITALVANKGDGIAFLGRSFGVPLENVAVIGDQTNDLPMFARAGFSIAMGQASDAVKAKARIATQSNDDDGVARAIDGIILPRVAALT